MTSVLVEPRRARLDSLTGLRFYAAMAVLLRHTVPELFPIPGLFQLSAIGPIGVGFFFVLSGFVLTWTWQPGDTVRDFYARRASRILPLHVLTTVIAVGVLFALGTPFWISSILSLFLLQAWGTEGWRTGGNGPSWSLSCEAFFYACLPFLVPRLARASVGRSFRTIAWIIGGMYVWTLSYGLLTKIGMPSVTVLSTYTNPVYRLGEFVIGICLATAMRKGWRPNIPMRWALTLAVTGYVALAMINALAVKMGLSLGDQGQGLPLGVLDLLYLPVTIMLIAAAAKADLDGKRTAVSGVWHVRLGEWSFALYLLQMIAVIPAAALVDRGLPLWAGGVILVGVWALCIAVSAFVFTRFERPIERRLRRRFIPAPVPAVKSNYSTTRRRSKPTSGTRT